MPTGDLSSGARSRTIRSQTQQRPAGLDGNSAAQSRFLDEGSSHPQSPPSTPRDLQQSPDHTRDFRANNQPCPQICASSLSQLFPHTVFPQSRAICLSLSAPAGIIHFSILSLLSQSRGEGYWAGSNQDRDLLSLPRAGWTPHCLLGTGIHPMHLRLGYLVTTLLPCGASLRSLLRKPQHRGCPSPLWDSNVPMAGGDAGRK